MSLAKFELVNYIVVQIRSNKTLDNDLFVCQIYVDDIIFGSTNESTCEEFSRIMTQKFEMSIVGTCSPGQVDPTGE